MGCTYGERGEIRCKRSVYVWGVFYGIWDLHACMHTSNGGIGVGHRGFPTEKNENMPQKDNKYKPLKTLLAVPDTDVYHLVIEASYTH